MLNYRLTREENENEAMRSYLEKLGSLYFFPFQKILWKKWRRFLPTFSFNREAILWHLAHHESFQVSSVDLSVLDLELAEGVVDLLLAELVAPGHQGVPEPGRTQLKACFKRYLKQYVSHLCVDLSVDLEGVEGLDDDVIVVGACTQWSEKGNLVNLLSHMKKKGMFLI